MAKKKKKKIDPIKQREKRAKIAAGGGALLLLVVAAIEVPAVMKMMNKKPAVAASAPAAASTPGALALPQVGAAATGTSTSSSGLADTDVPPAASNVGQLVTFNAFEMKNPFKPQVAEKAVNPNPPDPTPVPGATTAATATSPTTTTTQPLSVGESLLTPPGAVVPTTTTPTSTTTTPASTTPVPATAPTVAISVNGSVSRVGTAGTFPTAAPVFRLDSWQHGSAEISIVGGSYATGGQTLTLRLHHSVTLENTNDGKQYKLVLVSTP